MRIPVEIAVCPTCDGQLELEIKEWEDGGVPTESGTRGHCPNWDEWCGDSIQARMPYVYWLPIDVKIYRWAKDHVRVSPDPPWEPVTPEEYDRIRVAQWNAWARGETTSRSMEKTDAST